MRIVYMGTSDFAVPPLKRIKEEGYEIPLVITQPDRPKNRGMKVQPTPVKIQAEEYGIPVLQPESISDSSELIRYLQETDPDIIVVAAYGKLLPKSLLSLPRLGCVNIHASLLPKYRGAAPIQRAILSGDAETGVTLMYMSEGMDEGDMIAKKAVPIDNKTAGQLWNELALLGADLLAETLPAIEAGTAGRTAQDSNLATYAPKITKEDGLVDFHQKAEVIERQIRAMNPRPGAYTFLEGVPIKLFSAELVGSDVNDRPGLIKDVSRKGILVAAGEGDLLVTRIQMPGKRPMDVSEYIKGNKIEIGTVLG
ncbi:MAG: methionyl-tRNA formyltransferase [Anaerovoracaceae bacterium]